MDKRAKTREPAALITLGEASRWLGLSRTHTLHLVRQGKLREVPVEGALHILETASVLAELKARGIEPPPR